MKPAQWMAVLLLASMVGGITFVMVYLGGSPANISGTQPLPTTTLLTFAAKRYPDEGGVPPTTEIHQQGHHDFWFANDNAWEVIVGLNGKGCTCSEVEVALAPDDWKPRLSAEAAGRLLQRAPRDLNGLPTAAATYDPERLSPEMPEAGVRTTLLTRENSVVVPAGAIGWVRLRWSRSSSGLLTTYGELWMGQNNGSALARLDLACNIAAPVEVEKELSAGALGVRDLAEGKRLWIVCASATRPSFHIQAKKFVEGKAESDAVEVGEPEPLTAEQLRRLSESSRQAGQDLRSGYRIPVTLHAKALDGTPFGLGHFRRFVKLTSQDDGIEPMEVRVSGEVQGDVTVGDPKERGYINLGPFPRSRGAHGSIVLHTDRKELTLKLDSSRVPPYLKAHLSRQAEETSSGHCMWLLEVEVPPNAARGEFPRADDPVYLDSAIYVTTEGKKGEPTRSLRVPVTGTANENEF